MAFITFHRVSLNTTFQWWKPPCIKTVIIIIIIIIIIITIINKNSKWSV